LSPARLEVLLEAPGPSERAEGSGAARSEETRSAAPSPRAEPVRVFVSCDSAALAVGADAVAEALVAGAAVRGEPIELVRTSSRGAFWLEPLVEVETPAGRVGYGPVAVADVPSLLAAGCLQGGRHALACGPVDSIPFLARQTRTIFRRAGRGNPLSPIDYQAMGGLRGLRAALETTPEAIRAAVLESGLRGRGGAAFPAGIKWNTVAQTPAGQRHVVCNADEGDSGTFADRMLLEGDPYLLIEGMAIAAVAVGATKGFVYVRSEYPDAVRTLRAAIERAREAGWLGASLLGSGLAFDLEVRVGAGSYVCGEETAMLESLEGRRGIVRAKPPLPAVRGLFGRPTLIQNVLTFASVPDILADGAAAYRALGVDRSTGTMPFQLAGNVRFGGLVELPFGVTLRTLVFDFGGGTASGRPVKAIQVGGPLGRYVPESKWDVPLDYERYAAFGAGIGHGGIVVHDDTADLSRLARYAMEFCAKESCGKCTPCRIGSTRGVELIDRIRSEIRPAEKAAQVELLRDLCTTMIDASLCAMGGMTPLPVLSALESHPEDFGLSVGGPAAKQGTRG
jgi:formate dehydrogenase iron-sulfur subunit